MSWTKPAIEKEKGAIRAWIESTDGGPREKLRRLMDDIHAHAHATDSKTQLRLFLLVVFALVHYLRHGGLSYKDIRWLGRLGDTLLRLKGIESARSRVGFLYGDLHLLLSQIYWREGHQWEACWEQLLAKTQEGSGGKQSAGSVLAMANRALRLGQCSNALYFLGRANELGLEGKWAVQANLKRLMIHRLQGRHAEAAAVESTLLASDLLSAGELREVKWEKLLRTVQLDGDVAPLVAAVRKKGEHHEVEFACEAFLWTRMVPSLEYLKRFPRFRSLVYSSRIQAEKDDPLHAAVITLEQCYDSSLSLLRRLRDVGEVLGNTSSLINLNHELMVRAAVETWLKRISAADARRLALTEYQALCLKISDGAITDVLRPGVVDKSVKAA